MERAQGIDVSHHHPVRDWDAVLAAGMDIFGAKATNGRGFDPTFAAHRDGARAQPFELVLYYHFPMPTSSAVSQADLLVNVATAGGGLRDNERLVLDVEPNDGWCPDIRFVEEWVQEAIRLGGDRRLFVYTSARVWKEELGSPTWPSAIATDLWVPRYDGDDAREGPEPALPVDRQGLPVWPRWTLWQDSETFVCPGVAGPCDHNVWRGDREDLLAYVKRP
jgi:GH25 family lysozyme M1 (1,4-beta-N-acetylmuramidase)